MGKLILCAGKAADKPFVFPLSGTKVYSIEELCCYIYNNIYEITSDMFDEVLVSWLRDEAGMTVIANKLETMISINSSLKDIVISIMCSCDYYTEAEIKSLLAIINDIENLPYHGRQKQKADMNLKYGRYVQARKEYDKILTSGNSLKLTPEEYGNILHNRSIACFYTGAYREALMGFRDAYSRNGNKESLRHYLLALLINNQAAEFDREVEALGLTDEYIEKLKKQVSDAYVLAGSTDEYAEVEKMRRYSTEEEALVFAAGRLREWKHRFREGNV